MNFTRKITSLNLVRIFLLSLIFIFILFFSIFYFYQRETESNYAENYEELILNVVNLAKQDPHFFLENVNQSNFDNISIQAYPQEEFNLGGNSLWREQLRQYEPDLLEENSELHLAIAENNDYQYVKNGYPFDPSFIFHVFHLENNDTVYTTFLLADLSFLLSNRMTLFYVFLSMLVIFVLLMVGFYNQFKQRVFVPLNELNREVKEPSAHLYMGKGTKDITNLSKVLNLRKYYLDIEKSGLLVEQKNLSYILDSLDVGILYYDLEARLITSNKIGDRFIFLYDREQKRNYFDSTEFDLKDTIFDVVHDKNNRKIEVEVDNEFLELNFTSMMERPSVSTQGVLVTIINFTDKHQLETSRVEFVNNISHELRTPLVMIQGYSEAIIDDVADTVESKKEMAGIIRDEAKRMNRLSNNLLDLSKIDAGAVDLEIETVDLQSYLQSLYTRFQQLAEDKRIKLLYEYPNEDIWLSIDIDRMDQVLFNLINNSIRYTMGNDRPEKNVKLKLLRDKKNIMIIVEDTGKGIKEEDLPYIFDRFFKADRSRRYQSENKTGYGIGLSLVKILVEVQGGEIEVYSKINKGTRFIIYFPKKLTNS